MSSNNRAVFALRTISASFRSKLNFCNSFFWSTWWFPSGYFSILTCSWQLALNSDSIPTLIDLKVLRPYHSDLANYFYPPHSRVPCSLSVICGAVESCMWRVLAVGCHLQQQLRLWEWGGWGNRPAVGVGCRVLSFPAGWTPLPCDADDCGQCTRPHLSLCLHLKTVWQLRCWLHSLD